MRKFIVAAACALGLIAVPAVQAANFTVTGNVPATYHIERQPFACCPAGVFPAREFTGITGTFTNVPKGFYHITQTVPAGYQGPSISCTPDAREPVEDAPVVSGASVRLELSKSETKSCTFTNVPIPAAAVTPAPPPAVAPTPTPAAPVAAHRKVCRYGRIVIKDRHHNRATRCKKAPRRVRRAHPNRRPDFTG